MWGAILGIINKVLAYWTPEERKRKLRDELDKLEEERRLLFLNKVDVKKADRMFHIIVRIGHIKRLLSND